MRESLEGLIRRLLKVPPEPEPPLGAPGSVRVFRAARGFFLYRLLGWGVGQASGFLGILAALAFLSFADGWSGIPEAVPGLGWLSIFSVLQAIEALAIILYLIQLVVSFLLLSLDYKYRWYMITDRSLRIREGLLKVQERTMTFSNVQNVSIKQGPVQRLFGISDLEVRTAGGGSSEGGGKPREGLADNLHLGYFRGVANAAEIRDAILFHLRRLRTSGLGDPDEPAPSAESSGDDGADLLAAGRQVLSEARALRDAVA